MLKLIKLDEQYKPQLTDMMDEWTATGETIIPYAIRKCDYHDFPSYLASLEVQSVLMLLYSRFPRSESCKTIIAVQLSCHPMLRRLPILRKVNPAWQGLATTP